MYGCMYVCMYDDSYAGLKNAFRMAVTRIRESLGIPEDQDLDESTKVCMYVCMYVCMDFVVCICMCTYADV